LSNGWHSPDEHSRCGRISITLTAGMDAPAAGPTPPAPLPTEAPSSQTAIAGTDLRDSRIACRVRSRPGSLLHSGVTVPSFYLVHALGASVPLVAGIVFYGFRALGVVAIVVASAFVTGAVWRRIGGRGHQMMSGQVLWMAVLVALMLPAHLASDRPSPSVAASFSAPWPLLASAGALVVIILWLTGGVGGGRFHAALYTLLLLWGIFGSALTPHWVLARQQAIDGDLLDAQPTRVLAHPEPWLRRAADGGSDAFWSVPASEWMSLYTRGEIPVDRGRMPLLELLRDYMPPLEDLVVGGHPAPIGCASLIAVIVGGLFLMYRGVIDFRVPLLIVLTMYATLLILPIPTVITETGPYNRWFIFRQPDIGWAAAVTFVNYQIAAGPAVFMAFFLATAPSIRPLGRRSRALYAILIGAASAAAQLYFSVAVGPYLALTAVAMFAPALDRWLAPRTLV